MGHNDDEIKISRDEGEENMAAWLLGIKTLKIQPYRLPSLGIYFALLLVNFYAEIQIPVQFTNRKIS